MTVIGFYFIVHGLHCYELFLQSNLGVYCLQYRLHKQMREQTTRDYVKCPTSFDSIPLFMDHMVWKYSCIRCFSGLGIL